MLKRIVVRLLLVFVAVIGMAITGACIVAFLAVQQPSYYAELRTAKLTPAEQADAEAQWEQTKQAFETWMARSKALQKARPAEQRAFDDLLHAMGGAYDPAQDVHIVRLTERQLNAQLASDDLVPGGELQQPRIRLQQDRIDIACQFVTPDVQCVLSAGFKPSLANEKLRLELVSLHVGRLPLPFKTIASWFPPDAVLSDRKMELNLAGPTPHLTVKLGQPEADAPRVKSIECHDGEVAITFVAPDLKTDEARQVASRD